MANPKKALAAWKAKYDIKDEEEEKKKESASTITTATSSTKEEDESISSSSKKAKDPKAALSTWKEKYSGDGWRTNRETVETEVNKTSYLDTARNATKATISTSASKISSQDKDRRRKELETELDDLNDRLRLNQQKQVGAMRGHASNLAKEAAVEYEEISARISEINKELEMLDQPDMISSYDQLTSDLKEAEERQAKAQRAVSQYSGNAGGRALASVPAEEREALYKELNEANAAVAALSRQQEQIDYLNKWQDVTLEDDTFWNQAKANYRVGRITQDTNEAFNTYIMNPTEENKEYAYALNELLGQYQQNNAKILDDEGAKATWISKTAAGYVPQAIDQGLAQLGGGLVGGLIGSAAGNPIMGYRIGSSVASSAESFGQMRGAAYRALVAAGMDDETALEAANDEAFVSALIEGVGTYLTFGNLGAQKALSALGNAAIKSGSKNAAVKTVASLFGKSATDNLAKQAAKEAGKSTLRKGLDFVGGLAKEAVQEYGEEALQESVSIANQNRENTGKLDLAKEAAGIIKDAVTGKNDEALSQIHEAGKEGAKISLMFGSVRATTNTIISNMANAKNKAERDAVVNEVLKDEESLSALIEEGKASGENSVSAQIAQEIESKIASGKEVTKDDVRRLIVSNAEYIKAEDATQATEAPQSVSERVSAEEVKVPSEARNVTQEQTSEATAGKRSVPYNVMSTNNPTRNAVTEPGYGEHGTKAFAGLVEELGEHPDMVRKQFQAAYEAGRINLPKENASLIDSVQVTAYNAGQMDYLADKAKDEISQSKKLTLSSKPGFDSTGVGNDVTKTEIGILDDLSKMYGVHSRMVGKQQYNAKLVGTSNVEIASDFLREINNGDGTVTKQTILDHGIHEIAGHQVIKLAPTQGRAFVNAMYSYLSEGTPEGAPTLAERKQASYGAKNVSLTTEKAMEEIVVSEIFPLLYGSDPAKFRDAMDRVMNGKDEQAKQGARTFKQVLNDLWQKLKAIAAKLRGNGDVDAARQAEQVADRVKDLRDQFEDVMRTAHERAQAAQKTARNTGAAVESSGKISTDYEMKEDANNGRETGVHKRLASDIRVHGTGTSGGRAESETGSSRGSEVRYKDLTEYEKGRLTEILLPVVEGDPFWQDIIRALTTDVATEKLFDSVVQNAPVVIKMRKRIPGFDKAAEKALDFVARKNANTGTESKGADPAPTIETDSKGRKLTEAQQKFFQKAKTIDENGNLLVLYHGSKSDLFTEFDMYEGVWLTPDQRYAEVYAEQWHSWRDDDPSLGDRRTGLTGKESSIYADPDYRIYEMYANITQPANIGEIDGWLSDGKVREIARALGVSYSDLTKISDGFMEERTYMLTRSNEFIEYVRSLKKFDGLKATEGGRETWCAINAQDQVKLTTNKNPTSHPDIQFSMKDSDGKELTKEQAEFFKDSKVRDEHGNLQVVYHGTEQGGFTVFAETDDIGYFFTNSNEVARTYSGSYDSVYVTGSIKTWDDAIATMKEFGYDVSLKRNADGDYVLHDGTFGDEVFAPDELDNFIEMYEQDYLSDKQKGNYAVYLNIKNPLIINGNGSNWNFVYDWQDGMVAWEELTYEQQEAFEDEYGDDVGDWGINDNDDDTPSLPIYHPGDMYVAEPKSTREWVREAVYGGYDGVIFRNISDEGKYGRGYGNEADVFVALDSNQIKSVHNKKPTEHDDIRYSMKDSEGHDLSEGQTEYFKNSKVRDKNGNLLVVYHGSGAQFTEFSYDFIGRTGSAEGRGFYFTDKKTMAEGYHRDGGQLMEGYLNITKPLSLTKKTMKRTELAKLLKELDPTGDDIASGYDMSGGVGYPSKAWYTRAMNDAVKMIWEGNDNDSDILAEIANVIGDNKAAMKTAMDLFGYDGYIADGKYDGASVYVAFTSEQFKNKDNLNPTSDPDIRFSLKDKDYMTAVENGDMETAQRMVDEAAKAAGYRVETYHGTDKDFTVFETLYRNEFGYHVGTKKAAEDRTQYKMNPKVMRLYTRLGNTIQTTDVFGYFAGMHDYIFFVRGEMEKIVDKDFIKEMGRKKKLRNNFPDHPSLDELHTAYMAFHKNGYRNADARRTVELTKEYLAAIGVDSISYKNAYESAGSMSYLLFYPDQVKLADPVTYDDNGNVIPLSERFNSKNDDIRYSMKINTSDMSPEAKKIISHLRIHAMSSMYDKGKYASYSAERIDRELRTSSANKEDYAKSYIAWVEPIDFLYATTVSRENRELIEEEAGTLDLEKLRRETQPIHLTVDFETGEIVGHEGRHRMTALSKAGVEKVAVIFDAWNDDRYNTKPIYMMRVEGQKFDKYHSGTGFYVHDMLPLSKRYADAVKQVFSQVGGSMQFSLKEDADLQRENAKLKEVNATLREQFKTTKFAKVDKKELGKFARKLLKDYSSEADLDEVLSDLDKLYTYLANGEDGNTPAWNTAYRMAYEIAESVIQDASVLNDEMYREYEDLRIRMRTRGVSMNKFYEHDLAGYENLEDFRKRNFGRIKISKDATDVNTVYGELARSFPGLFNEEEHYHPADQLVHIAEVLESLQPFEENPFSYNMREATTWLANDIMERFFELPQAKPTFADKAERKFTEQVIKDSKKLERVREQNRERVSKIITEYREKVKETRKKEKAAKWEAVNKVKDHYKAKEAKMSESRKARLLRERISRHVSDLKQKLLKPTDKKHIPQDLQGAVAKLLESINQESKYEYVVGEDGRTHRVERGTVANAEPAKRTKAFAELQAVYAQLANELTVDPDLLGDDGLLNDVIKLADKPLADMTSAELQIVWDTLRAVEATVRTANKIHNAARWFTVEEAATALLEDNADKKEKTELRGILGKGQKLTGLDMETPETFFHLLGNAGSNLFRMMRNSQDQHIRLMKEVSDFTHETLGNVNVRKLESDMHEVTLGGEKVKLSTAQIMELYVLSKREQAIDHIFMGGILPDVVSAKGLKKITKAKPVRGITLEEVGKVVNKLTKDQRTLADKLQTYASTTLGKWGNQTSMKVYGYEKFGEKNYWPIRVNRQEVKSDIQKDTAVTSLANRSFTKGTKPHANNSLRLGSIFDTFSTHASEMATYSAWLGTLEDINRIRNYTFRDESGHAEDTVKSIIDTVHGTNGNTYLDKLLADVTNGVKGTHGETAYMSGLVGNFKAAAVGANLRVIIQQPTAMLRAADMIGAQYMAVPGNPLNGWKKALKYAPIAQWKDWGYFDINTGRQMKDVLFDSDTLLDKAKNLSMWGAGAMDSLAWGQLWNAVEAETKSKHNDLKPGSDSYYEAVAARFTEIVDHTQVVDGILQRSQIMRSADGITKMATSFMGEPTKQYNMMMQAGYDARTSRGKDRKAAMKKLARTATVLAISGIANAMAQSIIDAVRDDDKEEEYWEKLLSAFKKNLGSTFNPVAYVPFAKDIISILQGYDVTRMDMESIEKLVSAGQNMIKALSGEGKHTVAGAAINLIAEVARLVGVPVANLKREITSFSMLAAVESDNYMMQYRMEKWMLNMNNSTNRSTFMDILYNAYMNDKEAYEIIYADMIKEDKFKTEAATTADAIATAMETRMKKSQDVKDVKDLEQRYYSPAEQPKYDALMGSIQKSNLWSQATEEQRDNLEERAHTYIAGDSKTAQEMRDEIETAKTYGIDEAEYLLYKLALEMYDTPNENGELGGTPTNAEKASAIKAMGNLSNSEIAYLWDSEQGYEAYASGADMGVFVDYNLALDKYDEPNENGNYGSYNTLERAAAILSLNVSDNDMAFLWSLGTTSDEVWDAYNDGVDMDSYISFKKAVEELEPGVDYKKGDTKSRKAAINRLLDSMVLSSYDRNWLYHTVYKE